MQPEIIEEDEENIFLKCQRLRETEKAILVQGMRDEEVWLPLSQIEIVSEDKDVLEILIPTWLVFKNPLC